MAEARSIFRRLGVRPRGSRGQSRFWQRVKPSTSSGDSSASWEMFLGAEAEVAGRRTSGERSWPMPEPPRHLYGSSRWAAKHIMQLVNERPEGP